MSRLLPKSSALIVAFPPEIELFVEQAVAGGSYASREELIVVAVELLKERQADLAHLGTDIADGMRGEGIPQDQVFRCLRTMTRKPRM